VLTGILLLSSAQVAKAAAFVVSESLTVEQFFRRGAAIGLQMRQAREQGKPRTEIREWDDSGPVLLDRVSSTTVSIHASLTDTLLSEQDGHRTAEVSVRSSDEFRLICDPFYHRLPRHQQGRVAASRTYDLVYLGKRKQGCWEVTLSLHGSGDDMSLKLQQSHSKRRNVTLNKLDTLHLPLYFDGNSSSIHVGERNRDISELGLGLPPQPGEYGELASDGSGGEDSDTDSDEQY
jgi:hypothetical protein